MRRERVAMSASQAAPSQSESVIRIGGKALLESLERIDSYAETFKRDRERLNRLAAEAKRARRSKR